MFGNQPVLYAGYTAWRTVVEFNHAQDLYIGETWGRGCRFGIIPMSRGRVYWFAAANAAEGERDTEGQTKDFLARLFRGWHEPIEALVAAATEGSILRNDIYDMEPLPRWSQGRVVLLGDAAHPMTPNPGQGACQAIEDAVVLAVCLRKGADVDEALREYQLRRIPRTREVVLRSRRLGVVAQFENPVLCWMRNWAMRSVPRRMTARQMEAVLGYEILSASERELIRRK
jgi:2-polyprenyl-6-methoxyphenol hydroxylase-like FAD-dependent oxidoreductase